MENPIQNHMTEEYHKMKCSVGKHFVGLVSMILLLMAQAKREVLHPFLFDRIFKYFDDRDAGKEEIRYAMQNLTRYMMKYLSFSCCLATVSLFTLSCQSKDNNVIDTMGEMPVGAQVVASIDMTKPIFDILQRAWTETEIAEKLIGEYSTNPFQAGDYTKLGFDTSAPMVFGMYEDNQILIRIPVNDKEKAMQSIEGLQQELRLPVQERDGVYVTRVSSYTFTDAALWYGMRMNVGSMLKKDSLNDDEGTNERWRSWIKNMP